MKKFQSVKLQVVSFFSKQKLKPLISAAVFQLVKMKKAKVKIENKNYSNCQIELYDSVHPNVSPIQTLAIDTTNAEKLLI